MLGNLIEGNFSTLSFHLRAWCVLALIAVQLACNNAAPSGKGPGRGGFGAFPATPVTVATAEMRDVPVQVRQIGAVEAVSVIAVKAQIGGELTKVLFREGDDVRTGQQLFEIDPRPYQQAIDQAQAAIAKDEALIAQAQANLARDTVQTANAKEQAERYAALAKDGLISKDQNSTYQTTFNSQNESLRADEAAINSAKASLNVDKAALETAKLNLLYCSIRSPIDGRAGSLLVQAGNLVKANDTGALVNINQVQPVYVTFSVPEQFLNEIRTYSSAGAIAVTAVVSSEHSVTGKLTFIDNSVDNTTGTIKLKAEFPNADRMLWPGQFVNVVMTLHTLRGVTVVPSEAVQSGQAGQFVFVVKPDHTVANKPVKLGQSIDNQIVVESGISPGDTVVTDGQMRLIPGAPVRAVQSVNAAPSSDKATTDKAPVAGKGAS
jgi:membrane fusion protein, multidrug efflux system